jgi:hypothetical protein
LEAVRYPLTIYHSNVRKERIRLAHHELCRGAPFRFNQGELKVVILIQQFEDHFTKKYEVPYCYGDDIESILQTVVEFREACEELDFFTTEDQCREFHKCLNLKARIDICNSLVLLTSPGYSLSPSQFHKFGKFSRQPDCISTKHLLSDWIPGGCCGCTQFKTLYMTYDV